MNRWSEAGSALPRGKALRVLRPGRLPYADGLALQESLVASRRRGEIPDTLVLLEHEPVVTLGRGADRSHVLLDRDGLEGRGIALFETGRGGDVTVHNPGQVVGYPILRLEDGWRDTHLYLRALEEVMIRAARDFAIEGARVAGLTGVWVGTEKVGAIGVRIHSGWITSHGFAFNVSNDLGLFDAVVPCGIRGRGVTSLARLLGRAVETEEVMDRLALRFVEVFEAPPRGADTRPSETSSAPSREPSRTTAAGLPQDVPGAVIGVRS